jgi:hypothetical protein
MTQPTILAVKSVLGYFDFAGCFKSTKTCP